MTIAPPDLPSRRALDMFDPLQPDDLAALLSAAEGDPDPLVHVAALNAASRFPLGKEAWEQIARADWQIICTQPVGSPARREALELAVHIPLLTLRRELRSMAQDTAEGDRDAIAQALDAVGDPGRIAALLEESRRSGSVAPFHALAAMPVEHAITAADVPPLPAGVAPDFWRAIVLARLGEFGELDAFFSGDLPEPDLFWGAPWTAYDEIARIRPVPEPMRTHLLDVLAQLGAAQDQPQVPTRLVQLTVWAATGIADAEGTPIEPALSLPSATPAPTAAAPSPPDLPRTRIAALIRGAVTEGNRQARARAGEWGANILLGNEIVKLAADVPVGPGWPSADLVVEQLSSEHPALDDAQLAWIIARDQPRHLIEDLAGLLPQDKSTEDRLRILNLLAAAGDCQAGRAGSPFRGAGAGGAAAPARIDLIDDIPRQGAEPPAETALPAEIENRTVNALIVHAGQQRKTFVAGADNVIRCWIGLPQQGVAAGNAPIQPVFIPPEGLPLVVQMVWRDGSGEQHADSKPMLLPAERSARSGDCDLRLRVPPDERYVAAEIVFRYRGRVFEIVRFEAFALAPDEAEGPQHEIKIKVQASRREVIELEDSRPVHDVFVFGDAAGVEAVEPASTQHALLQFGEQGATRLDLGDAWTAIQWLSDQLYAAETLVVRQRAARQAAAAAPSDDVEQLDAQNSKVRLLLRDMARHGAGFYQRLVEQKGFRDPGERIQVVNRQADVYVPLEFVYDGGYPVSEAPLCADGLEALKSDADACPACKLPASAEKRDSAALICPYGFWSLRKVIERVAPGDAGQASSPAAGRRNLPVIDAVAFASSHLVPEAERAATRSALQQSFTHFYPADDWSQWKQAVGHQPPLLVVMPHHGIQAGLDYLEIGDEQLAEDIGKLSRGQLGPLYVNPKGLDPGPVVLLLGCQTGAKTQTGYVDMALRVQQQHASIVLGTLAQILGRHAAPVARALVAELVAVDDPDADFGTIMRRVRRRMLARGYLMALCLVALGDAEWRLTPRPQAPPSD